MSLADVTMDRGGVRVLNVPALLVELGLAASRSEARRLLEGGGVKLDGERSTSLEEPLADQADPSGAPWATGIWQVGRRRFARVRGIT